MKIKSYILVYIIAAVVIVVAAIFLLKAYKGVPDAITEINFNEITESDYTDAHHNAIMVDSFIELNKKAYGDLISINKGSRELEISLNNTNKLGTDYYNNNDNLLALKLMEHGFEVINDEKNNIIMAKFYIHKSNFVNVPNDVMISLMYKAYNK